MFSKVTLAAGVALGIIIAAPTAYLVGDLLGTLETRETERLKQELATAQSQRDAAHQDLASAKLVEGIARANAESNRQLAQLAEDKANEYAEELAKRGAAAQCLLDDADLERLSKHGIGSDRAAPSRR